MSAYQVLGDCAYCRCEAAVVQLMDSEHPACRAGVPLESRCRLCGWEAAAQESPESPGFALVPERQPEDLRDPERALAALARWAAEEGEPDVGVFCRANIGLEPEIAVALLAAGDALPTSFDVIAWLFPGGGGRSASDARVGSGNAAHPEAPSAEKYVPPPMNPWLPARALVSVMVADGHIRSEEQQFVREILASRGWPALPSAEMRVWLPIELGAPPTPEVAEILIAACVRLMYADRERDDSEWALVRQYARAWGVSEARVRKLDEEEDRARVGFLGRLWRRMGEAVKTH